MPKNKDFPCFQTLRYCIFHAIECLNVNSYSVELSMKSFIASGPGHEIMVLNAYAKIHQFNMHEQLPRGAAGLNVGLRLHHLFVCVLQRLW